jgi:hypothetical protein
VGCPLLYRLAATKLEEVVAHQDFESTNDGFNIVDVSSYRVIAEEFRDLGKCLFSVDVGVHRDCIGGEERGSLCIK